MQFTPILLLIGLLVPPTSTAAARSFSSGPTVITSPKACLSNLECAHTSFCDLSYTSSQNTCRKRLPHLSKCNDISAGECQQRHYCAFNITSKDDDPTCHRQVPLGRPCRVDTVNPCQDPGACATIMRQHSGPPSRTSICVPREKAGLGGTHCSFDDDCNQEAGFYCWYEKHMCHPKKKAGEPCDRSGSNYECQGFCYSVGNVRRPVCVTRHRENDVCSDDEQCSEYVRENPRFDNMLCNMPFTGLGICVRESNLLRKLGAVCDPDADRCDVRRALQCAWSSHVGKNVCQQLGDGHVPNVEYCTPGSNFSRCLGFQMPRMCSRLPPRPDLVEPDPIQVFTPSGGGFYECRSEIERLSIGSICHSGPSVRCEKGSVCSFVPGVRGGDGHRSTITSRLCVKIVAKGGSCENKFRTQCARGLQCIKGRCMKSDKRLPRVADSHASLGWSCSKLPCLPGGTCVRHKGVPKDSKSGWCELPMKMVGQGEPCYATARFNRKCRPGLVCALNDHGHGIQKCRKAFGVGAVCQNHKYCKGELRCSPYGRMDRPVRRCYDRKGSLPIGAKCDPEADLKGKRCISTYLSGEGQREMVCARKGKHFICQIAAVLYETCSSAENKVCYDDRMECGNQGFCIPKSTK